MHTNRAKLVYLSVLFAVLTACSNDSQEDAINEADQTDVNTQETSEYTGAYPEHWRPGSLTLILNISQGGDTLTKSKAQGSTKTLAKWDFILTATHQVSVMLPPDFTKVLPDYDAQFINARVLEEELFIPLENHPTKTQGQVIFNGVLEQRTPHANDISLQIDHVNARDTLENISVESILPSSIGKGFEATIQFAYKMAGITKTTIKYQHGSLQEFEIGCCEAEDQTHHFFPEPDLSVVQKVTYPQDAGLPPEIIETNQKLRLDMFNGLQKISNNEEPRATLHPGMNWIAEPNLLKLRYHSESANLLSQGDNFALAAPANQRRYILEIILKAD